MSETWCRSHTMVVLIPRWIQQSSHFSWIYWTLWWSALHIYIFPIAFSINLPLGLLLLHSIFPFFVKVSHFSFDSYLKYSYFRIHPHPLLSAITHLNITLHSLCSWSAFYSILKVVSIDSNMYNTLVLHLGWLVDPELACNLRISLELRVLSWRNGKLSGWSVCCWATEGEWVSACLGNDFKGAKVSLRELLGWSSSLYVIRLNKYLISVINNGTLLLSILFIHISTKMLITPPINSQ